MTELIKDVQVLLDPQGHVCDTDSAHRDGPLPEAHIATTVHVHRETEQGITEHIWLHVPSPSWPQQVMNEGIFTPGCPH